MPEVAEQAIEEEVDLIITHHPYYFHLPSSLAVTDTKMEVMYELIKHDIAVYAAHTNLDAARGGVNDVLADRLGLNDVTEIPRKDCPEQGLARIGVLGEPMELKDFAAYVRDQLAPPMSPLPAVRSRSLRLPSLAEAELTSWMMPWPPERIRSLQAM